jgi:hypothetical protein
MITPELMNSAISDARAEYGRKLQDFGDRFIEIQARFNGLGIVNESSGALLGKLASDLRMLAAAVQTLEKVRKEME